MGIKSVLIAVWAVIILLVILVPLPTLLLDLLLVINLTLALLILLNAIYAKDALTMSSFPRYYCLQLYTGWP